MFQCEETHVYFFACIGIIFLIALLIYALNIFVCGLKIFVLSRFFPPDVKRYGEWAVVTGSTNGIGKSYARELARRGMNVVLVSRNIEKLQNAARELKDEFNVDVAIVQADFTRGWDLFERIGIELKEKDIGILVNNVGLMDPQPCYFLSLSERNILDIIHVNITSLLIMTVLVLPGMMKRKRGIVVTMSSMMSVFIVPLAGCYGASKRAIDSISTALSYEKLPDITFQTLILSCVTTNLLDYSHTIWKWLRPFAPDADAYSNNALNTLGLSMRTTGYLGHSVQLSLKMIPESFLRRMTYWICFAMFKKQVTDLKSSSLQCQQNS